MTIFRHTIMRKNCQQQMSKIWITFNVGCSRLFTSDMLGLIVQDDQRNKRNKQKHGEEDDGVGDPIMHASIITPYNIDIHVDMKARQRENRQEVNNAGNDDLKKFTSIRVINSGPFFRHICVPLFTRNFGVVQCSVRERYLKENKPCHVSWTLSIFRTVAPS